MCIYAFDLSYRILISVCICCPAKSKLVLSSLIRLTHETYTVLWSVFSLWHNLRWIRSTLRRGKRYGGIWTRWGVYGNTNKHSGESHVPTLVGWWLAYCSLSTPFINQQSTRCLSLRRLRPPQHMLLWKGLIVILCSPSEIVKLELNILRPPVTIRHLLKVFLQ